MCKVMLSIVNSSLPNCVVCSEGIFTAELCCLQRISFVVEGVVCSELVLLLICVICSEGIFAAELCCLQRISFAAMGVVYSKLVSLLICVICNKWIFAAELCCLQRISFAAEGVVCNELVLLLIWSVCSELVSLLICVAYNELVSLLICVACSEPVSLLNCVVYNELGFAVEWCCLQWISFCCQIMLSATNQCLLRKLRCLQRINIRCQNFVVYNEYVFAAEIVSTMNQHSLPKIVLSVVN
jgi:hypothetical protein